MKILSVEKQLTSFRLRDFYSMKLVFYRFYAENRLPRFCASLLICLSFMCVRLCTATNEQYIWSTHNKTRHLTCKAHSLFCSHFVYWDVTKRRHDVCAVRGSLSSIISFENKGRCHSIDTNEIRICFGNKRYASKHPSEYTSNERKQCYFCFNLKTWHRESL